MPQRSRTGINTKSKIITKRPTKLQRQERRNERKGLPPPPGVQFHKTQEYGLNDILDLLQDSVPSFKKGSKITSEPDVALCLQCIPDNKARKNLKKYGDNIEWDAPLDSEDDDNYSSDDEE